MNTAYETDRIRIRPITAADTACIVRWRNAPCVVPHFIDHTPLTPEVHAHWLATRVANGEVYQFVIEQKNGRGIGSVYLRDVDKRHSHAELGVFIGEEAALGKGYGGEACRLLCRFAFEELGLARVFLRVLAENAAAVHTYEKCGFVKEGCFRRHVCIDGQLQDVIFMGLLREELRDDV